MSASPLGRPFSVPTLDDLGDVEGRSVLVRADLDVRLPTIGQAAFDRRLGFVIPTLRRLLERGAVVSVCGHCGDLDTEADEGSFRAVARTIEQACPGAAVLPALSPKRERTGAPELVAELVGNRDFYVNEAFQWCWLSLASIVGPPAELPSAAGLRLASDLELLEPFLERPVRPFVVVFGSDQSLGRLPGLRGLVLRADAVLLGGAMALPFLQAIGVRPVLGRETQLLRECRSCFGVSQEIRHVMHLPSDLIWEAADGRTVLAPAASPVDGLVSDIGPKTRLRFGEVLQGAGSVLWAGALGRAEDARFREGTLAVAAHLPRGKHVVLGGDALLAAVGDDLPGATGTLSATDSAIALLKDGDLPGLAALRRSPSPA